MGKTMSKRYITVSRKRTPKTEKSEKNSSSKQVSSLVSNTKVQSTDLEKDSHSFHVGIDLEELTYGCEITDNLQQKIKKSTKDTVNDFTGLTLHQCKAVQESWETFIANNPIQIGIQFFMRFFLNYPDYRNFYSHFRSDGDMTNKEVNRQELRALRDTVPMRDLAATYIESLTTIINTLENQEEVTDILEYLTDRHLPRGVLSLHFQDMLSTLLVFMEEKMGHNHMTTATRDSWTCALRTIITIIDQRYLELQHKKYIRKS